jgi:outer membrane immunogenic protein
VSAEIASVHGEFLICGALVGGTKIMKKLLIAGAALVALGGSATAADLGTATPVYKAPPPVPVWTWTGFYIGGHAGGGWATANWTSDWNCNTGVLCDPLNTDMSGWLAGGQAGYRWQTGAFVFGVEGTVSGANIRGTQAGQLCTTSVVTGCPSLTSPNPTYTTRINQQETVTVQGGYAWDRALLYAKGGWAGGNIVRSLTDVGSTGADVTGDLNQRASGWTAGAGLEYMFWKNLSFGIEYDFVHLPVGSLTSTSISSGNFIPFSTTQSGLSLGTQEVLARLNYRFSFDH